MKFLLAPTLFGLLALTGCAQNSAPGSANARINDGRNRRDAHVSDSDYRQHHRQRTDQEEEYQTRQAERDDQYNSVVSPLRTVRDAASLVGVHY